MYDIATQGIIGENVSIANTTLGRTIQRVTVIGVSYVISHQHLRYLVRVCISNTCHRLETCMCVLQYLHYIEFSL